jgi:DNA-binding GntR family transcriptional regulator
MSTDDKVAVYDAIRGAILRGDFVPRERLVEADLCERFGVARFGVRTALRQLASEGLVEFQPNRGARVRDISFDEAIEITEVRKLLEGFVASRAAERITKSEVTGLREIITQMGKAVEDGELLAYSKLNVQLHESIRQIAKQETTARLLRQLRDQLARHEFTLSLVPGRASVSLPQHEKLVAAITARRPVEAQAAMHEHLDSVIDALRALPVQFGSP